MNTFEIFIGWTLFVLCVASAITSLGFAAASCAKEDWIKALEDLLRLIACGVLASIMLSILNGSD